jgi:hypothetical protein
MKKFRKKPVVIEAMQWDGSKESRCDILRHFPEMKTSSLCIYDGKLTLRNKAHLNHWKNKAAYQKSLLEKFEASTAPPRAEEKAKWKDNMMALGWLTFILLVLIFLAAVQ